MNCDCIKRIEKEALANLKKKTPYKKPVKKVSMAGVMYQINDSGVTTRTVNMLEITLEGQKKMETFSMLHSYCPFCGIKEVAA